MNSGLSARKILLISSRAVEYSGSTDVGMYRALRSALHPRPATKRRLVSRVRVLGAVASLAQ